MAMCICFMAYTTDGFIQMKLSTTPQAILISTRLWILMQKLHKYKNSFTYSHGRRAKRIAWYLLPFQQVERQLAGSSVSLGNLFLHHKQKCVKCFNEIILFSCNLFFMSRCHMEQYKYIRGNCTKDIFISLLFTDGCSYR